MLNPFEPYLLSSSTSKKKQFNEVHTRASRKSSGSYTGQNSRQWWSFLQWYDLKAHRKLRYKLMWSKHEIYIAFIWSMIVSSIAWFFFLISYFLKRKIHPRIQCWYPMWWCHKSLRIASLMGGNPLGEKYTFEYYFTYIQYIYI